MLLTNDLDSPKFFGRKVLNSVQVMGATSLFQRRLNCIYHTLMLPQRKDAVKGVQLVLVAREVSK